MATKDQVLWLDCVLNNLCESQWLILEPDNILGMKDYYS